MQILSSNTGKYRTEKTPYLEALHTVFTPRLLCEGKGKHPIFRSSPSLILQGTENKLEIWGKKLLVEYFFNKFADRQGAPQQLYSK